MSERWHEVRIHWGGGRSHDDGIRGANPDEAIDNAVRNWVTDTPYEQAERIEYLGSPDAARR